MIAKLLSDSFDALQGLVRGVGDFTGDVFFGLATSYPSIALLGIVAAATFAVAHLPFIDKLIPSIVPYAKAAGSVCLVASAAMMFAFGYRVADGRDEIERLKNDIAFAQFNEGNAHAIAALADQLKNDAEARAKAAEGRLGEYESKFGKNPLDPPAGWPDWVRSLQRHPQRRAHAGTNQPQRGLVARVRGLRENRQ